MQNLSNMSAEEATIAVLSRNPSGSVKAIIKAQLIRGTRKAIANKARADSKTAWTPELVLKRMHKDSDPKVFLCYELAGIDEAKLLEIARQSLESIGIKCPSVIAVGPVRGAPEAPKQGKKPVLWGWIKNIFWSVKK